MASNWALRDPLESGCHLGEGTFDTQRAGFWAPVCRKWNSRLCCLKRVGLGWAVFSEVIKAFWALKMIVECLELEAQLMQIKWCIRSPPGEHGNISKCCLCLWLGGQRQTECTEAGKPRCCAVGWERRFSTGWDGTSWACREDRVHKPGVSSRLDHSPPGQNNRPRWRRSATARRPDGEAGSFSTWIKSPSGNVSRFTCFNFLGGLQDGFWTPSLEIAP